MGTSPGAPRKSGVDLFAGGGGDDGDSPIDEAADEAGGRGAAAGVAVAAAAAAAAAAPGKFDFNILQGRGEKEKASLVKGNLFIVAGWRIWRGK